MKRVLLAAVLCSTTAVFAGYENLCQSLTSQEIEKTLTLWKEKGYEEHAVKGLLYVCGVGVAKDESEALRLWKSGAQTAILGSVKPRSSQEKVVSSVALLFAYYEGFFGASSQPQVANYWLRIGAQNGNSELQLELGRRYLEGESLPRDVAAAERWLTSAVMGGSDYAILLLARHFYDSKRNYEEAAKWLRIGEALKLPAAEFWLGLLYMDGFGVPKDFEQGMRLIRRAADSLPEAQLTMGWMYMQGNTVPKDMVEAMRWFRMTAEQGFSPAKEILAQANRQGVDEQQDIAFAQNLHVNVAAGNDQIKAQRQAELDKWVKERADTERNLRIAASDDTPQSKLALAAFLDYSSNKETLLWLERASEQGSEVATYKLGVIYWNERIGTHDQPKGLHLIKQAAANGYSEALFWLARAYDHGAGLKTNKVMAYALYFLSSHQRENYLALLEKYQSPVDDALTKEELKRGKELVLAMSSPEKFLDVLEAADEK
jgi:uncharacterized protein